MAGTMRARSDACRIFHRHGWARSRRRVHRIGSRACDQSVIRADLHSRQRHAWHGAARRNVRSSGANGACVSVRSIRGLSPPSTRRRWVISISAATRKRLMRPTSQSKPIRPTASLTCSWRPRSAKLGRLEKPGRLRQRCSNCTDLPVQPPIRRRRLRAGPCRFHE